MATTNIITIKRRLIGAPGAPTGLVVGELAYNQVDNVLYYGFQNLAGSIDAVAIAGSGAYVSTTATQDISGDKSFYGTTKFAGPVSFDHPITFNASDFNIGKLTSYYSISSLGFTTLSSTTFYTNAIVDASTANLTVSTVSSDDKSNKAASTDFVQTVVGSVSSTLNSSITSLQSEVQSASSTLNSSVTSLRSDLVSVSSTLNAQITAMASAVAGGAVLLDTVQSISGVKTFVDTTHFAQATIDATPINWSTYVQSDSGTVVATLQAVQNVPLNVLSAALIPNANINLLDSSSNATVRITNLATPTGDNDAATKAYVDAATAGLNVHESVVAATTGVLVGWFTDRFVLADNILDGVTLQVNDRVLVKDQETSYFQNGIFVVDSINGVETTLVRADDYNNASNGEVAAGDYIFVVGGATNAASGFIQTQVGTHTYTHNGKTVPVVSPGEDAIRFTQFSGAGEYTVGAGLTKIGSQFSLSDVADVAGNYLGLTIDAQGRISAVTGNNSLTALATTNFAADQIPMYTEAGVVSAVTITSLGKVVLTSSVAAVTAELGLGDMSLQSLSAVSITGGSIASVTITGGSFVDCTSFTNCTFDAGTF